MNDERYAPGNGKQRNYNPDMKGILGWCQIKRGQNAAIGSNNLQELCYNSGNQRYFTELLTSTRYNVVPQSNGQEHR